MHGGNGHAADAEENARFLAAERDPAPAYATPPIIWQGPWKIVADLLNLHDWRVWIGVTAALSALASRNIWVNYYGPLYGMGAYLLVAPSGTGKSIVTKVCERLLPASFRWFDSIESGQALLENIADIERDKDGKITRCVAVPALLLSSEWTQTLKAVDYSGSTLMERVHKCVDGESVVNLNRADKRGHGAMRIERPTLSVCATTTAESYAQVIKDKHISSGFLNRHLVMPTEDVPWVYDDPRQALDFDAVSQYAAELRPGHTFGLGRPIRDCYTQEAFDYDLSFGQTFLEPLRAPDAPPHTRDVCGRLHQYHRRLSMLYAWAMHSDFITSDHVHAAEAAVRTSHHFLTEMHANTPVDMPVYMKARSDIEEKILARVTQEPDVPPQTVCQSLRRNGGYQLISQLIEGLVASGALLKTGDSKGGPGRKTTLRVNSH